ncbi:MAG: hypothetical protein K9M54_12840 [Kiritimatiellales bacterium]|nr:hypothetical protein [Kiritimatiellales bacterium]
MYIGIDQYTQKVYESPNQWAVSPLKPAPFLFNAQFGASAEEAIAKLSECSPDDYKFREDLFDPVSRIKRGRVYRRNASNLTWHRFAETEHEKNESMNGMVKMDLPSYGRIGISNRFKYASIGTEQSHTAWRIVAVEQMITDEELITLQPVLFMGILPDVDASLIPSDIRQSLLEALEGVVTDMKRAMPGSVIDRCRGAAALALQTLKGCKGKDLGKQANHVETVHKKCVIAWSAKIINTLHTRAKENIRHDNQYRPPNERDAELAVHCLACILTELEFAK